MTEQQIMMVLRDRLAMAKARVDRIQARGRADMTFIYAQGYHDALADMVQRLAMDFAGTVALNSPEGLQGEPR